jgi:hypothetical protein
MFDELRVRACASCGADESVGECEEDEFGAGFELEFAHDVCAVGVDGSDGDEEFFADFLVGVSEGEEVEDVAFTVGEWLEFGERVDAVFVVEA